MKADTLSLKALFQKDVRYVIPTFQRPYVWNQEDQWEPLWNDLRNTAERYLEELDRADGNNALAEERAVSHFMGAVVLQQEPTPSAEVETRRVIDGQQRLTTMQLVIDAAQEVFEELAVPEAERLARLVTNAFAKGDAVFKLWPTALDREAYRAAMTNALSPEGFETSPIVQAHDFFRLQIREWLDAAGTDEQRARLIHGLETALFGLLELVVIDLATADDAFVIFETLNARGTPLLDSDLIKNYVLQTATANGEDVEALYNEHWQPLEDRWWRTEVKQGRIFRPRVDVFLNYWLVMRTAEEVPSSAVFERFKAYVERDRRRLSVVAEDLCGIGAAYRHLETIDDHTPEGTFIYRWRVMEAGVITPVLLWIFAASHIDAPVENRVRALRAIESFFVRRMLCRMTTKNYNELFLELLSRLYQSDEGIDDVVIPYLAEQTADSRLWPDDLMFESALLDLPLYRLLTRGRMRMVLEALEDSLRSDLAEEAHVGRGVLTVEHVLPQSWRTYWPLEDESDFDGQLLRERLLHSLGNLTLVNGRLNPALSNREWAVKQDLLREHSVLHLNKGLLSDYEDAEWDEEAIRARGTDLAQRAARIWPSASNA